MATITKSIGTSSRDYSTITAWEADLDNTGIYTSGDDAVGECYNDSTFNETISIDGGGTVGLNNVDLTVADGQKHDGTEGTGVRIVLTATATAKALVFSNDNIKVDWLEIDYNGNQSDSTGGIVTDESTRGAHHLIMHGVNNQTNISISAVNLNTTGVITNSILYDLTLAPGNWDRFIHGYAAYANSGRVAEAFNCVAHGFTHTGTKNSIIGFRANNNAVKKFKNCISGDHVHSVGASSSLDFKVESGSEGNYNATLENNISEDDTATTTGTNSIANTSPSSVFVSVVSGSEDFHLSSTSPARGAGTDLVATPDGVQYDINGSNRNALTATVWDIGAHQYASTASIGTSSRDYSTITLWEADLDDTTVYGAGANAVGECYNDSTFTDGGGINGGGTVGLNSVKLTAAAGNKHDGTAGTGAKFVSQAWYQALGGGDSVPFTLSDLETDYNSQRIGSLGGRGGGSVGTAGGNQYHRLLLYNGDMYQSVFYYDFSSVQITNNIIYNMSGSRGQYVVRTTSSAASYITNNTAYKIEGNSHGYYLRFANTICKNCMAIDVDGNCFAYSSSPVAEYNISSDGTASGTGSKTNQPASRQFVSTLSGSEDLHLIFKSAAIDAGVDLGTTPDGVQYDINGKDRDTENSIWDIGAHEYGDNVIFGLLRV